MWLWRYNYKQVAAAAKSLQLCPTLCDPHLWQPTRLPCPWDSPVKNTGVGCHFLLQCMKVKSESEVAQSCPTLATHGLQPTRLLRPWDFLGRSTGVGCHCLLQQTSWSLAVILIICFKEVLPFAQPNFIYLRNWVDAFILYISHNYSRLFLISVTRKI